MTNIEFLNYVNAKIVKHIDTNEYFAFVGALYGYNETKGYDNGILFKINENLISDSYSVKDFILAETYKNNKVDEPVDNPTDEPTDEPTDNPTDEPTDNPIDEPVDEPTDKPTDEPTDKPTDEPTDNPIDEPTDNPIDEPVDEPTDKPTDEPTDKPTDEPTDNPTDEPVDNPTDKPTDEPTDKPTDEPTDNPTDNPVDEPTDNPANEPTDNPVDEPTDNPVDNPTDNPVDEPTEDNTMKENVHIVTDEDIARGLFNVYIPVRSIDLSIYKLKNDINNYKYSEDELNNFCATFMRVIQYLGNFANDNMNTSKNQIYKRVIDFYANNQNDTALINLMLILKSETYKYNDTSSMSMCGCSSATNDGNLNKSTDDCVSIYQNAMLLYIKQMLSDLDFYYDFFYMEGEPIEELIEYLIILIEEFKTLGYDLSFSSNRTSYCGCSRLTIDNGNCNYNVLDNYIRVLNWINECKIEEHANQIKIYGEQFAEILPKLQF